MSLPGAAIEPTAADAVASTATAQPHSALLSQIETDQASLLTEVERILGTVLRVHVMIDPQIP